ncbi:MAG: thrombospondin type 3 repeat-containing protein, partial [Planctomycetota bacterium]
YIDQLTGCIDVAYHANTGTVFAAAFRGYVGRLHPDGSGSLVNNALWRSTDHGDTWTMISGSGGFPGVGSLGRMGVTVDPYSNTVYALVTNGITEQLLGVYKSTNMGDSWIHTNDGPVQGSLGYGVPGFGWFFGQIRVAPGYPDIVYSMGVTMWKSEDGGNSWFAAGGGTHVDHHAMTILEGNPEIVYHGCDGGVNYTSNGALTWTNFNNMANTQFYAMAVDYQDPDHILGGTQDNGTNRTRTGSTDDWEHILGGDGFYCLVDYTDPNIIYAESQRGGLNKSINGGLSFSSARNGIAPAAFDNVGWNTPVAMDPVNPKVLYFGTNYVYQTMDGAENWNPISPSLTSGYITTFGVARSDNQVVYAGSNTGTVYVTTNGGGSWSSISGSLPNRWVTRLTVDPSDAGVCYVTISGYVTDNTYLPHIYRTDNYGVNWTDISSNLPEVPLNDVIVDPHDNQTLYLGSDVGVYVTYDLGGSWSELGTGMPINCVHDLEMNARNRQLVAATHGRSMFKTLVPCPDDTDSDGDGVGDACDNCPDAPNAGQEDIDGDLIGDACDECNDPDQDGFDSGGNPLATCPTDNCPYAYNPNQLDSDEDGIGDACEFVAVPVHDTAGTACVQLQVNNAGNFGGSRPYVSMDYANQGDCANMYIYDGSVVVAKHTGAEYVADNNVFGAADFKIPMDGNPLVPTTDMGDYQVFQSGTFVTDDETIGLETDWFAPAQADSCQFVIQRLRVYS